MRRNWIKLYVDQTLRGTCFIELLPDERFIWFGFLLLAGDNAMEGKICVTEEVGFSNKQLASLLKCDVELINRSIKKMIKYEKIKVSKNNIVQIINWQKYQSEYQRQRDYRKEHKKRKDKRLHRKVTSESYNAKCGIDRDIDIEEDIEEERDKNNIRIKEQVAEIINYLNKKSHKNFRPTTVKTISLIKARFNEKFNVNDFKKVIDVKIKQWLNNEEFEKFLRPETLFGNKFESYLNEHKYKKTKIIIEEKKEKEGEFVPMPDSFKKKLEKDLKIIEEKKKVFNG